MGVVTGGPVLAGGVGEGGEVGTPDLVLPEDPEESIQFLN